MPVPRLSPNISITIGLVSLTLLLFLLMDVSLGIIPDEQRSLREVREQISTNLALQLGILLQSGEQQTLTDTLKNIQGRNNDILSIAVRRADGELITQTGLHWKFWVPPPENHSTLTHVQVPVLADNRPWANIEISFKPPEDDSISGILRRPAWSMPLGILLGGGFFFYLYLRRVLQHLDPTQV